MQDGEIPVRTGEFVNATRTINALNKKLQEAEAILNRLHISASAEVAPIDGSFGLKVTVSVPGGAGFIETIHPQQVDYYAADPEPLLADLVEKVFDTIYKQHIQDVLTPIIGRGIRNAIMVRGKL